MFYTGFCRSVLFVFVRARSVATRKGKVCEQLRELGEGRQRVRRKEQRDSNSSHQQRTPATPKAKRTDQKVKAKTTDRKKQNQQPPPTKNVVFLTQSQCV